ncbi:MAG: hypothetical protein ACJAR8_001870 [Bacteroidia bacterium]|jgi:hypothetical protein
MKRHLEELNRSLISGGLLSIAYAQKSFMQTLLFVQQGFRLYNNDDIVSFAEDSPFELIELKSFTDSVFSKSGLLVDRIYSIAVLKAI